MLKTIKQLITAKETNEVAQPWADAAKIPDPTIAVFLSPMPSVQPNRVELM